MNKLFSLFLLLAVIFAGSCTSQHDSQTISNRVADISNLPDNLAGETVKEAIDKAGGWENWTSKKSMAYRKVINYYDSSGAQIRNLTQMHRYQLQPQFKANISWTEDENRIELVNDGTWTWKLINGEVQKTKADTNEAWNSTFGSHYVATMPFKLADSGTILTDAGVDTLPGGEVVRTIKVDYEEWAGSAGGMHTWYYYFNRKSGKLTANSFVYEDGRLGFTDYTSFASVGGILLPDRRVSYTGAQDIEITPDSVVYLHQDINLDVALADTLFE